MGHTFHFDVNIPRNAAVRVFLYPRICIFQVILGLKTGKIYTYERHFITFKNFNYFRELYTAGSVNYDNIIIKTSKHDLSETNDLTMVVHLFKSKAQLSGCHLKVKQPSSCQTIPLQIVSDS